MDQYHRTIVVMLGLVQNNKPVFETSSDTARWIEITMVKAGEDVAVRSIQFNVSFEAV